MAPLASSYDLVVVDTPPVDTTLQALALNASRWLLIPTKADASSIRGIQRIAERVADARQAGHEIDILGVVLAGVPTAARRVRAGAIADITAVLGDSASLLDAVVRSSDAVARECRTKGILAHELAEQLEGAEPFWRALRNGSTPQQRVPGSAPALADDYIRVTEQVLLRLSDLEACRGGGVTDSRFSSIGQILDRRIPPAALPEDDSSSSAVETTVKEGTITRIEDAPLAGRARERQTDREPDPRAAGAADPATSSRSSGGARRIVFRLDPDLHRSLGDRATAERTSYGQLVLDAVEAVHSDGQLPALAGRLRLSPRRHRTVSPTPGPGPMPDPRCPSRFESMPARWRSSTVSPRSRERRTEPT